MQSNSTVNLSSKRQLAATLGTVVFFLGLVLGLYLSLLAAMAEATAAFLAIVSDMPVKPLKNLRCPALLARNESGTIIATLDGDVGYSIDLSAAAIIVDDSQGCGPVTLSGPESARGKLAPSEKAHNYICSGGTSESVKVTLPPGEAVDLTWRVSVTDDMPGELIALKLYAFGEGDDRTYADVPFRTWDFSYTGGCGIAITNVLGLTGRQTIALTLSSMLLGGAMWLCGSMPLSRPSYAGTIIGFLLWLSILWQLGLSDPGSDAILFSLTLAAIPLLVIALLMALAISIARRLRRGS